MFQKLRKRNRNSGAGSRPDSHDYLPFFATPAQAGDPLLRGDGNRLR
jgi:hypothetical protein